MIDAVYFREKVRVCLRLAEGLPWNSPARYQLLLMAEDFRLREIELETGIGALRLWALPLRIAAAKLGSKCLVLTL
jgi:hypothetical protein